MLPAYLTFSVQGGDAPGRATTVVQEHLPWVTVLFGFGCGSLVLGGWQLSGQDLTLLGWLDAIGPWPLVAVFAAPLVVGGALAVCARRAAP